MGGGIFTKRGTSDGIEISMNLKTSETTLETNLTLLRITMKRTKATLQAGQPDAIERQQRALKAVVAEADQWQRALEEQKIVAKQDLDEISEWNTGVDAKLIEAYRTQTRDERT